MSVSNRVPSGGFGAAASGRHELVVVPMDPVAESPASLVVVVTGGGDGHGSHDLPHLAFTAEQQAAGGHPAADARRVAVELEWARIEDRSIGPRDWGLRRHDVQDVHPPRGALDDLLTSRTARRDVVADDRADLDAHDLHRRRW